MQTLKRRRDSSRRPLLTALRIRTAAACFALALAGCQTQYGSAGLADVTAENVDRFVVRGRTTQAELLSRFGPPTFTSTLGAGKSLGWQATSRHIVPFAPPYLGPIAKQSMLVVILNESGVVKDYQFTGGTALPPN